MNRFIPALLLALAATPAHPPAQSPPPAAPPSAAPGPQSTISVTSREVLVDVLVTDHHGKPITGLKQSDFSVTEQGKPQSISFFEEHTAQPGPPIQLPKLPPDVFTNVTPFRAPAAVNVLLLDSLNTPMDEQSYVHTQALKFLSSAKPGSRMAIFTMGLGLHFVQGFTDDPSLLVAAIKNPKNNEIQSAEMLKGQEETNAQQNLLGSMGEQVAAGGGATATAASASMIASLQNFINENDISQSTDRIFLTLQNLQRLATFLNSFPGRKNVIWFSQSVPTIFASIASSDIDADPRLGREIKKTLAMLASARVALYPVEAAGVTGNALYQAGTVLPNVNQAAQLVGPPEPAAADAPSAGTGGFSQTLSNDDQQRNANQENMRLIAEDSGGRAFVSTNSLSTVLSKVISASDNFYTLTYIPTDSAMDGTYRHIHVQVAGGDYQLSYRRGYYAVDSGLPGDAMIVRNQAIQKLAEENHGAVDPLLPFMALGMPQSQQIPFDVRIQPMPDSYQPPPGSIKVPKQPHTWYDVEIGIDPAKLALAKTPDGFHKDNLNLSLIVYDRYGNLISREDHLVNLDIKSDAWGNFLHRGLYLHAEFPVPKGHYWIRIGVFDNNSRLVGTLEVPFSLVKPVETAPKAN